MDLSTPAAAVLPALRARVLMVLVRADTGLTGRRVAALAPGSVAGVAKVLEAFVRSGVVHRVDAGSASLYTLNRQHLATPALQLLAGMRVRLIDEMRRVVGEFVHRPVNATLFGSAARGEGDEESDVDLLLVRPDATSEDDQAWADDVRGLASAVLAWTGNPLGVVEYSGVEMASGSRARRKLLDAVERDGVLLHGTPLGTLRARAGAGRARR